MVFQQCHLIVSISSEKCFTTDYGRSTTGGQYTSAIKSAHRIPQALLATEGVIRFTNIHRANNGLPLLSDNALLNTCALEKVKDMFEKQYFAHDSAEGFAASDLAKQAGYRFITIGENLALGNFLNDKALVEV